MREKAGEEDEQKQIMFQNAPVKPDTFYTNNKNRKLFYTPFKKA